MRVPIQIVTTFVAGNAEALALASTYYGPGSPLRFDDIATDGQRFAFAG